MSAPKWHVLWTGDDFNPRVVKQAQVASGAYAIRDRDSHEVRYVGESARGVLWKTMLRHFQAPDTFAATRNAGIFTGDPKRYEVAIHVTSRGHRPRPPAEGSKESKRIQELKRRGIPYRTAPDQRAMAAQAAWIASLRPSINKDPGTVDGPPLFTCPECYGDGVQLDGDRCPVCNGSGRVTAKNPGAPRWVIFTSGDDVHVSGSRAEAMQAARDVADRKRGPVYLADASDDNDRGVRVDPREARDNPPKRKPPFEVLGWTGDPKSKSDLHRENDSPLTGPSGKLKYYAPSWRAAVQWARDFMLGRRSMNRRRLAPDAYGAFVAILENEGAHLVRARWVGDGKGNWTPVDGEAAALDAVKYSPPAEARAARPAGVAPRGGRAPAPKPAAPVVVAPPQPKPAGYGDVGKRGQLVMFNPSPPRGALTLLGLLTRLQVEGRRKVLVLTWGLKRAPLLTYDEDGRLHVVYRGRVERASTPAEVKEYERSHWGAPAAGTVVGGGVAVGPFLDLGAVHAVTYTTKKGSDAAPVDYVHEFGEGSSRPLVRPRLVAHDCKKGQCGPRCAARDALDLHGGSYRVTERGIVG